MLKKVVVQKKLLNLDICRENWRQSSCYSKHKQHNTLEASFSNCHQKASSSILGSIVERNTSSSQDLTFLPSCSSISSSSLKDKNPLSHELELRRVHDHIQQGHNAHYAPKRENKFFKHGIMFL